MIAALHQQVEVLLHVHCIFFRTLVAECCFVYADPVESASYLRRVVLLAAASLAIVSQEQVRSAL